MRNTALISLCSSPKCKFFAPVNFPACFQPSWGVLLMVFTSMTCAASPASEIDHQLMHQRYQEFLEACSFEPRAVELRLLSGHLPNQDVRDCVEQELSAALLLFRRENATNESLEAIGVNLEGCDTAFDILRYNLGLFELNAGRADKAAYHLGISAASHSARIAAKSLTALGDIAYQSNEIAQAENYFLEAYRTDSIDLPPMLLNNLCALFLTKGQFEEATKWGKLALERGKTFSPRERASVPANFEELVLYNLFIAYVVLGQTDEAMTTWEALDFAALQALPLEKAELLSMFTRLVDAPTLIQIYGPQIRADVHTFEQAHPEADIQYNADPLVWIFTTEADSLVSELGLQETWQALAARFPLIEADSLAPLDESTSQSEVTASSKIWPWLSACLLAAMGLTLVQIARMRKRAGTPIQQHYQEIQRHMQTYEDLMAPSFQQNLQSLVIRLHGLQAAPRAHFASKPLNDSEKIVLRASAAGTYPKDIAQSHNWSPTYVYILRSSVRKKLNIPNDSTFVQWKSDKPKSYDEALNA